MITIVMKKHLLHPWSLKNFLCEEWRKGPKRKRRKSSKHFFSEAFAACFSGRVTENPLGMIPRSESWKHHAITDCNWDIKTKFYVYIIHVFLDRYIDRERERGERDIAINTSCSPVTWIKAGFERLLVGGRLCRKEQTTRRQCLFLVVKPNTVIVGLNPDWKYK